MMRKYLLLFFIVFAVAGTLRAQQDSARYIRTATGYLMVLRQGDQVLQQLEILAIREQIPSASFSGFGFVDARFGYFNSKTREYEPKDIRNVEMANMTGTIAWQDGKPSIHAHAVVADKKFKAFGGHLLQATVGTGTVEISITVYVQKLERKKDETLGANILQLP